MKRKYFWVILMTMVMLLIGGCGKNTEDVNGMDTTEENVNETAKNASADIADTETVEPESEIPVLDNIDSRITEKDDSELELKAYYYTFEDKTVCEGGEDVFGSVSFESTNANNYVSTGKVPIYAQNGVRMGYTKENVDIIVNGIYNGWCYFDLNGENKYARLSDIEANSITIAERDAKAEEEASKQEETSIKTEIPVTENISSEQPIQNTPVVNEVTEVPESNKYTPDEAIAVYRSLMEAGGITWDPSIKDVTSWGTGWLNLEKGQPEWAASTDLESFAIGGHGGNSWTKYYMEVTGSDDEAVYYTQWSSN